MKTADFDFELPGELIAQRPARPRDSARLLDARGAPVDRTVRDLPDLLSPKDLVVVNDTRVIPAQLSGRRGTAKVGVTLHRRDDDGTWRAFARPAKRLREGDRIDFAEDFAAEVLARDGGEVHLRFTGDDATFQAGLARYGHAPLPPYIKRDAGGDGEDASDYQTMFAAREGAVAAPTAGLHFTPEMVAALEAKGVGIARVTLHVGAGTFLPVTVEDVADHRMHSEWGEVDTAVAARINAVRAEGGRIVSIGTTALRLLESAAGPDGTVRPFSGETDIFITPGYRFRAIDLLFTNFHLPRSTLFMLVCAFAGTEHMRAAYAHAIENRYRFFSYGDATLLARSAPDIAPGR